MHPIKATCKRREMTYLDFSEEVKRVTGVWISPALIAQYASQMKIPGRRYADLIHQTFPEVSREALLYPNSVKTGT